MSIAAVKSALRTILQGVTANYGGGPVSLRVYDNPREQVNLGELPVALIGLAPALTHTAAQETRGAFGLARHQYSLRIWLIVGTRQTPIFELTARCQAWVEPIIAALMDNVTLNGAAATIGAEDETGTLATYVEGAIQWGDNEATWYGLIWTIPVVELISLPVNP